MYNNGTIGFHRGSIIDIPLSYITLGGLLEDAKLWCKNNPKELVIIFHSQMVHEAGYNGLGSKVYMEADDDAYKNNDDGENGNEEAQEQQQQQPNNDDLYYQQYYQDDALQQNYYQDDAYTYNDDDGNANDSYSYFYTGIAKLKEVYDNHGVPYYPCTKLAGLTVEEAMELADLSVGGSGKGYLMAVDRHDVYGEF